MTEIDPEIVLIVDEATARIFELEDENDRLRVVIAPSDDPLSTSVERIMEAWLDDRRTLRALLLDARDELARWGWGDFHYGRQPQEKRVVDMLARIDAVVRRKPAEPIDGGATT